MVEFQHLALGGIGICTLLLIWVIHLLYLVRRQIVGIGAHRPTVPTEELVKYWRKQLAKHPPGSPKHKAYSQRLAQYGD